MPHARKRFGQHFLRDPNVIRRIIASINPQPDQVMVEIGPGEGVLTQHLVEQVQSLTVIEIDRDLIPRLERKFGQQEAFQLIESDVLKIDFTELAQQLKQAQLRVIGNLPYNISTPLMFHLCQSRRVISDMVFMLQKEVVDRMVAKPGNKTYGRLSVMIQYYCQVQALFDIGPKAFSPPPKVDSSVVQMIPYQQSPYPEVDEGRFTDIVRAAFNHRRKTLSNCLKGLLTAEQIAAAGIEPSIRAENLSVAEFVQLSLIKVN